MHAWWTSWRKDYCTTLRYGSFHRAAWRHVSSGCRSSGGRSRSKAQCISVAPRSKGKKKKLSCVGCRTVLVCISSRCVDRCECRTCAWLLSLIVIVLILLCTAEPPGTMFTVRTNTSQSMVNSPSLFTRKTSWRQNVADIFVQTFSPPIIKLVYRE